eukprot:15330924-Ditylum_brightwellii.AAC.1
MDDALGVNAEQRNLHNVSMKIILFNWKDWIWAMLGPKNVVSGEITVESSEKIVQVLYLL